MSSVSLPPGLLPSNNLRDLESISQSIINLGAGTPNGLATLDSTGKLLVQQIPPGLASGITPLGTYNATTNSPSIESGGGGGSVGDLYFVSVSGTVAADSIGSVNVGDQIINIGSEWQRIPGAQLTGGTITGSLSITGSLTTNSFTLSSSTTESILNLFGPNYIPIWTLEDSSGNLALSVSSTGNIQIGNLTIVESINLPPNLTIPNLNLTNLAIGLENSTSVKNLFGPNFGPLHSWEDSSGNITAIISPNGVMTINTLVSKSATFGNLSTTGSFAPSQVNIGNQSSQSVTALLPGILTSTEDTSGNIAQFTGYDGVTRYATDPAYFPQNRVKPSMMATVSPPVSGDGAFTNIPCPATIASVFCFDADYDWIRLVYCNDRSPSNWNIGGSIIAPSATLNDWINPLDTSGNPVSWTTMTFNNAGADLPYYAQNSGSATTVMNMGAVCVPQWQDYPSTPNLGWYSSFNYYLSDWINVRSLPRTDGGQFALLFIRTLLTSTGTQARAFPMATDGFLIGSGSGGYGLYDAIGGRSNQSYSASGDYVVSTTTGFPVPSPGATPPGYIMPTLVQGIMRNTAQVTVLNFGDSIHGAVGSNATCNGWIHKMTQWVSRPNNTGLPIHLVQDPGVNGTSPMDFWGMANLFLPIIKPQVLVCQAWSRNWPLNGIGEPTAWTQGQADTQWQYMMQITYKAQSLYGTVPILVSPVPNLQTANSTDYGEPFRLSAHTRCLAAAASGMVVLGASPNPAEDWEYLLGTAPGTSLNQMAIWLSSGTGIHPNDIGQQLMGRIGAKKMRAICGLD